MGVQPAAIGPNPSSLVPFLSRPGVYYQQSRVSKHAIVYKETDQRVIQIKRKQVNGTFRTIIITEPI